MGRGSRETGHHSMALPHPSQSWALELDGIPSMTSAILLIGERLWSFVRDFSAILILLINIPSQLASTLLRKMALAIPQAIVHHRAFSAFSDSLYAEHGQEMNEWEVQVKKWEGDHDEYCPYNLPDQSEFPEPVQD